MRCPHCKAKTDVLSTRKMLHHTTRRYECMNMHRFTTREYHWDATNKADIRKLLNWIATHARP